jgi:hypothetical protein
VIVEEQALSDGDGVARDARELGRTVVALPADLTACRSPTWRSGSSPGSSYITGKIIELDGGAERPVFPGASADLQAR